MKAVGRVLGKAGRLAVAAMALACGAGAARAACDGTGDDHDALVAGVNAAAASGIPFVVTGACRTGAPVPVPSGAHIQGRGGASIAAIGRNGKVLTIASSTDVQLRGLTLDGNYPAGGSVFTVEANAASDLLIEDLTLRNSGAGLGIVNGSTRVMVSRARILGSHVHAVHVIDSTDITVRDGRFDGQRGFGIVLVGRSSRIKLLDNTTMGSGLEMVGIVYSVSDVVVSGNHAYDTGDNCYSLTGTNIVFTGNFGVGCAGNGLDIYGSHVTATGNHFRDNARGWAKNPGWAAGIFIGGGFGGTGQHNIVVGNVIDDSQAAPTQQYGVLIAAGRDTPWQAGAAVPAGAYRLHGLNIYKAAAAGTAGGAPPVHAAGTVSDGGVGWIFSQAYDGAARPDFNVVQNNQIGRSAVAPLLDRSGGAANVMADPGAAGRRAP